MNTLSEKDLQEWLETESWDKVKNKVEKAGHILLPAMIDSHVHFRIPGGDYKEDWEWGSKAAIAGGICGVCDMPNTNPPIITKEVLDKKIDRVKKEEVDGFKDFHYLGVYGNREPDLRAKDEVVALKVYTGSSTGDLLVETEKGLEKVFKEWPGVIAVHAEDEKIIQENIARYADLNEPIKHSKIRSPEAAVSGIKKVLKFVKKFNRATYFCHVSTETELEVLVAAKEQGLPIYIEVTPHHLYLDESAYDEWGNFVKINPPLRTKKDNEALWLAVSSGIVDVIASDHAPHLPEEKALDYANAPAGVPGVGQILPLMLNAVSEGRLSLERLIECMHDNPKKIFGLKGLKNCGVVVDLKQENKILKEGLGTKCGWSPYEGMTLKGWPEWTIIDGQAMDMKVNQLKDI
ncbi:dihydroorotase [Patescibacteria group bacterium]|nr:dihydroorotase [Patescibacteria group bacterium]MBU1672880.1 dihydroorotase [Patescibacteria group bacterium]MBU1963131.1 dihydroorotase [Patescibacteria group bacterium]